MAKMKDKIKTMVHEQDGRYSVVVKYKINNRISVSIEGELSVKTGDVFGEKHSLIYSEDFLDDVMDIIRKIEECEDKSYG